MTMSDWLSPNPPRIATTLIEHCAEPWARCNHVRRFLLTSKYPKGGALLNLCHGCSPVRTKSGLRILCCFE